MGVSNFNLPNFLTVLRILVVPVILVLLARGEAGWAFALFLSAALTDIVDGLLARVLRQQTVLGAWLDPFADKLLVFSAFVALTLVEPLSFPVWFTIAILGRDFIIVTGIGVLHLLGKPLTMRPTRLSKYATFLQATTLTVALGARWVSNPGQVVPYLHVVMALCLVMAVISVGQYFWRGMEILRESRPG